MFLFPSICLKSTFCFPNLPLLSFVTTIVMSADAFAAFEESGFSRKDIRAQGMKFRDSVLSLGGSLPAKDVFQKFRGRGPSEDALLRHSGILEAAKK